MPTTTQIRSFSGLGLAVLCLILFIIALSMNSVASGSQDLGANTTLTVICTFTDIKICTQSGDDDPNCRWVDYGDDGSQKSNSSTAMTMNIVAMIPLLWSIVNMILLLVIPQKLSAFWLRACTNSIRPLLVMSTIFALIGFILIAVGNHSDGGCMNDNNVTGLTAGYGASFVIDVVVFILLLIGIGVWSYDAPSSDNTQALVTDNYEAVGGGTEEQQTA